MSLYLDSGYLDFSGIASRGMPFNLIVGGRGTGKTYGALKYAIESGRRFMFMRRTQTQLDLINKPDFSPFKTINRDLGISVETETASHYNARFILDDETVGYSCALSTISSLRGFDASDIDMIIYDEFIPERHERPIVHEGTALLNAYETINRNRELAGKPAVQLFALANSNDLGNPIFMELGLVLTADKMRSSGSEVYADNERGILLIMLASSLISEQKTNTALYRLTAGSDFSRMSIGNEFSGEERSRIGSRPLREYTPLVTIGELTIYSHKSNREYYCTRHRSGSPAVYGSGDIERKRFCRSYSRLWDAFIEQRIVFEDYSLQLLFTKYFN